MFLKKNEQILARVNNHNLLPQKLNMSRVVSFMNKSIMMVSKRDGRHSLETYFVYVICSKPDEKVHKIFCLFPVRNNGCSRSVNNMRTSLPKPKDIDSKIRILFLYFSKKNKTQKQKKH